MLKKLASCVGEYKIYAILSPVFMMGEVAFEVLIPYYMADLVDLGVKAGNMEVIKAVGLKLLLMAMCSLACGALAAVVSTIASAGFANNLRLELYHHIQSFSFSNIDKFSTAGLVTRTTTDVTNVQMAFMMVLRMAFRAPGMLIFALIMAFRTSPDLAKIFLYVTPFLAAGMIIIMGGAAPLFRRMFDMVDGLNAVIQENIRGIRVVKAFVREDKEEEKFGKANKDLYDIGVRTNTRMAFMSPVMQLCMYACMMLISWYGAHHIVYGDLTTGQLMSVFQYIMQILSSLMMFAGIVLMLNNGKAAADRIVQVLDEEPDIANCQDPVTVLEDGSIEFDHVYFGYGQSKDCLEDINISIKSGETVGILGGTGSGKTSLVQLIPRLYDVRSGSVMVGGSDVRDLDMTVLRENVAMVLQKNILFSGTVADNLRWGKADATMEEMQQACRHAQADSFIEKFEGGYDYWIEQGGTNVSGGQRQRLCIARALIAKPRILILDDSTSAVDTHTESLIRQAFREDLPDTTKIIIAQRISSVRDADRIIVLDDGKINGTGTHEELLENNAIYREVYESQTKGGDFDAPK